MNEAVVLDLFAEDQAHEEIVGAMVRRAAREAHLLVNLRIRRARGGHGRALEELKLYQRSLEAGVAHLSLPDILVVAIDANCKRYAQSRKDIEEVLSEKLRPLAAIACPDPHIERWCLVDPASFQRIVGITPRLPRRKCARDLYKSLLADSVKRAGHVPTLGGIEFAEELIDNMDFYQAGRTDKSLKAFLDELSGRLKSIASNA